MLGSIGMPELMIIFVVALIIFGPRKLPELGRSLGKSLGEFKRASNELRSTLEDEIRLEEQREARATAKAREEAAAKAAAGPTPVDSAAAANAAAVPSVHGSAEPLVTGVDHDDARTTPRTGTGA
jgi:TatA/E family protein of Tat protein translocase